MASLSNLSFQSFSLVYLASLLLMLAIPALLFSSTRPFLNTKLLITHPLHPQPQPQHHQHHHQHSHPHRHQQQQQPQQLGAMTSQFSPFIKPRVVVKKLLSKEQPEGDGALVRRSIGRPELKQLDPFLLLDEFTVSSPAGFPDHPHRGFETVTYMLEGAFTHQDFSGRKGTIKPGDLQWMTAGRGIVHCEMPAKRGKQRGLQLWVNLAARDKMYLLFFSTCLHITSICACRLVLVCMHVCIIYISLHSTHVHQHPHDRIQPNYQEVEDKDVPKVQQDGVSVSVIAGESMGIKSPVYTRTRTMYLDFKLEPGAVLHQAIPEGWNAFAYVLEGESSFGSPDAPAIGAHHTIQLGMGDGVSVWNKSKGLCRFVLIGGQPLNEPMFQHGPFVMNSREQVIQAVEDYQKARNGFERAAGWRSDPVTLE